MPNKPLLNNKVEGANYFYTISVMYTNCMHITDLRQALSILF